MTCLKDCALIIAAMQWAKMCCSIAGSLNGCAIISPHFDRAKALFQTTDDAVKPLK